MNGRERTPEETLMGWCDKVEGSEYPTVVAAQTEAKSELTDLVMTEYEVYQAWAGFHDTNSRWIEK